MKLRRPDIDIKRETERKEDYKEIFSKYSIDHLGQNGVHCHFCFCCTGITGLYTESCYK